MRTLKKYELKTGNGTTLEIRRLTDDQVANAQRRARKNGNEWIEARDEKRVHWLLQPLVNAWK